MVDALREAHRVLEPSGAPIDVRPVTAPIVGSGNRHARVWGKRVYTYSAQEDVAAADAAVQLAVSREWLLFDTNLPFPFEIYCDCAAELRLYAEARKLRGAEISYEEVEKTSVRPGEAPLGTIRPNSSRRRMSEADTDSHGLDFPSGRECNCK
jgi:hypothetical protein